MSGPAKNKRVPNSIPPITDFKIDVFIFLFICYIKEDG